MSKTTNRDTVAATSRGAARPAAADGGSAEQRLARLLDTPFLARVVPHLPPETLHQLIRSRGLDACSELVTSATPAQLTSVLDLDLWRPSLPGRDDQFDVERFGEWLEMLVDSGDSVAAHTVAALDKNLVVAGLSRYVRVLDQGVFEPVAQSDDERPDRHDAMREGDALPAADAPAQESGGHLPECEVGGFVVRARRADMWDAVVALLVALDAEHGAYFNALMQGCRGASNAGAEIDGLDDLLTAPEQQLHDVAIEREQRRSQQGYATPADARAFLEMARQPKHAESAALATGAIGMNPIVSAYFRAADEAPEPSNETGQSSERASEPRSLPSAPSPSTDVHAHAIEAPQSIEAVMELLAEAGVMPARPRALLDAADADPQAARLTCLRRLMAYIRDTHETAYFARSRELAFLANALLAGCSVQSRPFTSQEASDAAAGICNLGLEYWPARWPGTPSPAASAPPSHDTLPPDSFLVDHDLVTAFEVGWSVLHQDVGQFAAEQVISTLEQVRVADRDIQRGLVALRRALVKHRGAGKPWLARGAAEVLAELDMTAWVSVVGLLDECPIMPAALTAILESRTTSVSPTAFDFISTAAQIDAVRTFMRRLPDVLTR
jgi:hypothetical protein